MYRLTFKTTLYRSNPQCIREFEMDDSATVEELLGVFSLTMGWKKDNSPRLIVGGIELELSLPLNKAYDGNEKSLAALPMEIHVPISGNVFGYRHYNDLMNIQDKWIFRLEMTDRKEKTGDETDPPRLLRAKGMNIPEVCDSVPFFNKVCRKFEISGSYYVGMRGTINAAEYVPDIVSTNCKLSKGFSLPADRLTVDMKYAEKMKDILSAYRVEDLKTMIRERALWVETYLRKAEMIDELCANFGSEDFWESFLEKMTFFQYMAMKNILTDSSSVHGKEEYESLLSAFAPYLLYDVYDYEYLENIRLPIDFLIYYQDFLDEVGDSGLISDKKASCVLSTAVALYGLFSKKAYEDLCVLMFPESPEIKERWQKWGHLNDGSYSYSWVRRDENYVYSKYDVSASAVEMLIKEWKKTDISYYLPERDEAFQIAKKGLDFPADYVVRISDLIDAMQDRWWSSSYNTPEIRKFLYRMQHDGASRSYTENALKRSYNLRGTVKNMNELFDTLKQVRDQIRLLKLHGHSEDELGDVNG